jgi:hypothetical protein
MFFKEWPVLLVDDEPDVLAVSKLAIGFQDLALPQSAFRSNQLSRSSAFVTHATYWLEMHSLHGLPLAPLQLPLKVPSRCVSAR